MVTKEEFVKIITRLKETDNLVKDINNKIRNTTEAYISDFTNAGSLMICHEDIVVSLLENIFKDKDIIGWWIYELDYGRKFEMGYLKDNKDKNIDVSTSEKLYDYLIKNME